MADLAVAEGGWRSAPRLVLRPLAVLGQALAAEGGPRLLWLPVFFGTGIAAYFALTVEPAGWIGVAATAAAAVLAIALCRRAGWRAAAVALAFAAAGFAAIQQ